MDRIEQKTPKRRESKRVLDMKIIYVKFMQIKTWMEKVMTSGLEQRHNIYDIKTDKSGKVIYDMICLCWRQSVSR